MSRLLHYGQNVKANDQGQSMIECEQKGPGSNGTTLTFRHEIFAVV